MLGESMSMNKKRFYHPSFSIDAILAYPGSTRKELNESCDTTCDENASLQESGYQSSLTNSTSSLSTTVTSYDVLHRLDPTNKRKTSHESILLDSTNDNDLRQPVKLLKSIDSESSRSTNHSFTNSDSNFSSYDLSEPHNILTSEYRGSYPHLSMLKPSRTRMPMVQPSPSYHTQLSLLCVTWRIYKTYNLKFLIIKFDEAPHIQRLTNQFYRILMTSSVQ